MLNSVALVSNARPILFIFNPPLNEATGCSSEREDVALLPSISLLSNPRMRLDEFHDAQRTKLTGAEPTARKRRRRGVRVEREVRPHGQHFRAVRSTG